MNSVIILSTQFKRMFLFPWSLMIIHMMLILHQKMIWFCLLSDTPCPDFTVECHTCSVIQLS